MRMSLPACSKCVATLCRSMSGIAGLVMAVCAYGISTLARSSSTSACQTWGRESNGKDCGGITTRSLSPLPSWT